MRAMTLVARVTFLVLVGATFSAFFVAQRLKSAPSVITVTGLARYFSPNGDKVRDTNEFRVRLKVSDDVTVDVVNLDGDRIKRLADSVSVRAYSPLTLVWNGMTDAGDRAPDGRYRLRVALRDEGRSATVQQTMNVDTKAPRAQVCIGFKCSVKNQGNIISQGDREVKIYIDRVSPFYATTFRVLRTDDGKPREVTHFELKAGAHRMVWNGLVDNEPLPLGTYIVQSEVRDIAGNVGISPTEFEQTAVRGRPGLTVRGLAAQPPLRPVTAGQRVEFGVDARGASYRWQVRRVGDSAVRKRGAVDAEALRKDGSRNPAVLAFRAPEGPSGVYLLELRSGRWHTSVPFLVQAVKRSTVLVVVPAITWLGTDRVDDSPFDGLPNTLGDGGKVALFGADMMRRGVRLRVRESDDSGTLLRATQPTPSDPFGARLGKLRTTSAPVKLSQMDDNTDYGLMEGALDLTGFTQLEESAPVTGKGAKLLTGVGQPLTPEEEAAATASGKDPRELRPALTAVQLGKGTVIRVGLPEWSQRLDDPSVSQVTRNIVDILRNVPPRIRSTR